MGGRFNIPPPPQEKGPSEWWPALAMLAAALALAAVFFFLTRAGCAAMSGVPGVAGQPVASASSTLRDAGYTPTEEQAPSTVVPRGHVIDTVVPDGGSDSDVVVIVSSGPGRAARTPKTAPPSASSPDTGTAATPAPVPEPAAAPATTVADVVTASPSPTTDVPLGDATVASEIRDQRTQVAAIEGALVAPGSTADSTVVDDARARLEDIAGQAPAAAATPCASAAQRRWLASLNRALQGDLTPAAARALRAAADKAAAEVAACSSGPSGGTATTPPIATAARPKANPPGSAPRVAFAYNKMSDVRVHLADARGKVVGVGPTRAGYLVYDKAGTLWLSSGGWDNSGESSAGCDVRRFGDKAPAFSWSTVREQLVQAGDAPAGAPTNNLLCGPLDPAPEGGVLDVWKDVRIRMPRRGRSVFASPIPPATGTDGVLTLWNGDLVRYSRDPDGRVISSDVAGAGTVSGEVVFVSPGGDMLVVDRGGERAADEISLRRADGSSHVVWPRSLDKRVAIHREDGQTAAMSRDGKWVFVQAVPSATVWCMACSADVYRVDTAGTARPVKVASDVVTLAVPPLPARRPAG